MFFPDKQDFLNDLHAGCPRKGDYWHEMICPIARVLMVDDEYVLVQKLAGRDGTTVTAEDPKPTVMTRRRFSKWLRYDSKEMAHKTWADVMPEYFEKQSRKTTHAT